MLSAAVVSAVQETSAHASSVFLRSGDGSAIVLVAACGTPPSLLGGWRLIPVTSGIPVAAAYRSGRTVHLADADETAQRFPQLAMAVPYAYGSASVPVRAGSDILGALAVVWPAPPGTAGLSKTQLRHLRRVANRLGSSLAVLEARGELPAPDARTIPIEVPAASPSGVRVGLFDWHLGTGALAGDDELCAIFGLTPEEFDGRAETLESRIHPADLGDFHAVARNAEEEGRASAQRLRVRGHDGRMRPVEIWGRVPQTGDGEGRRHLVGAVLDPGAGSRALAAVERLGDGVASLDPDGRLTYANRGFEQLLHVDVEDVLGRCLWDVLPWLSDPAYEDRHRATVVSQQSTSFLACRPPDQWLAFTLFPAADGVTVKVTGRGSPAPPSTTQAAEPSPSAEPARLGAIYHVLQLGSGLTEAVTSQQVCEVVADQLLPAFGGRHTAIFVVREGRMHLAGHADHDAGFLDWLEGAPLYAHLPGTEALTSRMPLFIESQQDLAAAYPGTPTGGVHSWVYIPLIASSRPVGTCVLGFDENRRFTANERGILSALGGLIAQALERARLYDEEFAVARGLQHALLPHRLPAVPDVRITGRYLPGTGGMDIGGDWYDVIKTPHGASLVIGDVEGHSVAAAATMGQLRSVVRAFVGAGKRPGEVVAGTNRLLGDLDTELLASCCYLQFDSDTGTAVAVRAGHCPPLLRSADGTTRVVHLETGALLGADPAADYPETELELPPDSVLALYTDGLVEEVGADIDVGIDRLRTALAHTSASTLDELADRLLVKARRSADRADDIALLLAEYSPGNAPAAAGR
ncbi:SpoIIE family protein phosphatase [Streptomyces sp. HNM0663]|uniref:SpoIIE family protein phosphatase n=1 Tax=Streptomyces chengmaiensis TaxID=3040919 RepID=A0ABT6HKV8_9ACTN|nr:SpoIIE family protein phosphatase [Streptomyces chengmaiensis]MDH2389255.1 SpoIIE family protein phosphatase [Streptomyces chengmaiensis]